MIVGFSAHGRGNGYGPVNYFTSETRPDRAGQPPVVVSGCPETTRALIDATPHDWKYTSGVLSFAPGETITPEMELAIIAGFEKLAFAGLDKSQYDILWVRHTHAGHHELHFVTPRMELETEKSLNIRPPGDKAKQHFDDFRSLVNAKYGLADPDDPARQRSKAVAQPLWFTRLARDVEENGGEMPQSPGVEHEEQKEVISYALMNIAAANGLSTREELIEHVKNAPDFPLKITRVTKTSITVETVEEGKKPKKYRLKGKAYGCNSKIGTALPGVYEPANVGAGKGSPGIGSGAPESPPGAAREAARDAEQTRETDAARRQRIQHLRKKVQKHINARAEYHKSRYIAANSAGVDAEHSRASLHPDADPGADMDGSIQMDRAPDIDDFRAEAEHILAKSGRRSSTTAARRKQQAVARGEQRRIEAEIAREFGSSPGGGEVNDRDRVGVAKVIAATKQAARTTYQRARNACQQAIGAVGRAVRARLNRVEKIREFDEAAGRVGAKAQSVAGQIDALIGFDPEDRLSHFLRENFPAAFEAKPNTSSPELKSGRHQEPDSDYEPSPGLAPSWYPK